MSIVISWWRVHRNFLFPCIHPHQLMKGAQEFFVPVTSTLITLWQVHKNFWFHDIHPHHEMTGAQEFFVPVHPPSSAEERCTGIFCSWDINPHHLMTGPQEFLVPWHPPSSLDDRCTRIFHSRDIHPHHVMTGAQEFCVPRRSTCHHVMTGPQEFLLREGLPSSFTSSNVLHTEPHVFHCCQAVMSFGNHKMAWWSKYSLWEEVPLQKMMTKANGGKRGKILLMIREETFNWSKNFDPKGK